MKKLLLLPILLIVFTGYSQTALPYFIGFDNTQEILSWTEYRKGSTVFDKWEFIPNNAYSPPYSMAHWGPIGSTSLTDDWIVSPAFNFSNGAFIDSIRYAFDGAGVPSSNDTIAIYLLNGSPDPALATSVVLLKDYRGFDYPNDNTWRKDTNIVIPAYSGSSYIALRYMMPSFTSLMDVHFDNIAISANTTGIIGPTGSANIEVFPNPANDNLNIRMVSAKDHTVEIYNISGQWLGSRELRSGEGSISLRDIEKGMVIVKIFNEDEVYFKKILIQ